MSRLPKVYVGAAVGAVFAVLILVLGLGGALLVAILAGLGAGVGILLDRPELLDGVRGNRSSRR